MIATVILFLSLGLDALAVSIGLGVGGLPRARWLHVGLLFALFEGGLPIVGLLVGQRLGPMLGEIAGYGAALGLIVIGLLTIREAVGGDDDKDDDPAHSKPERPLVLTAFTVGLDELAVGFSLGVLGVPLGPALGYIGAQAFVLTFVGLALGTRVGARLGERAELASGVILTLLGCALLIGQFTGAEFL